MRIDPAVHINLPLVCSDVDRHGNRRYYIRLPGKARRKVRIRAEPGTEEFAQIYWRIRKEGPPQPTGIQLARPGTFRALVEAYYLSPEFASLDAKYTQVERERQLDPLVVSIGDKAAWITPETIRDGIKTRASARARKFLAALRHLYAFGVQAGLVKTDPTFGLRAKKAQTDGFHSWTVEECLAYEKRWPLGTKQRTAYAIGLYLAARRSDAVRIGRQHVRGASVTYTQAKNEKRRPVRVTHPIVEPLQAALRSWQGKGLTWLETQYGKAYTPEGFGNAFAEWCGDAGIGHCSFHGLRKACAARMAEAGYSTNEIQSALGDKTLQQAAVYTRAADNARMAASAFEGVFGEQVVPPLRGGETTIPRNS